MRIHARRAMQPRMTLAALVICETCRPDRIDQAEERLSRALVEAGLAERVALLRQACLNCCADPSALALQAPGRATYVFAGVDLESDLADIIATLRLYLESPRGWIEDARACGRLRLCLKARVMAAPEGR